MEIPKMLFGCLNPRVFRPLSGSKTGAFYARVLSSLLKGPFAAEGEGVATREEILRLIGQVLLEDALPDEGDGRDLSGPEARRYAYNVILEAGWIEEGREGWKRVVEMPPIIMRLGGFLIDALPKSEDEASIGRSVAAVDSLLSSAEREPARFGHALLEADRIGTEIVTNMRGAHLRARAFSRSLFSVNSEEEVIRGFFENFVRHLHLRDYREMTSLATHPWRLRNSILDRLDRLREGGQTVQIMTRAMVESGLADSERAARAMIEGALHNLARALDTAQEIRDRIEKTKLATERRFETSLRYRTPQGTTALISYVLSLPLEKVSNPEWRWTQFPVYAGPHTLRLPERRRSLIQSQATTKRILDPRIIAWQSAMHKYAESLNPTQETLADKAHSLLSCVSMSEIEGADITCESLSQAILLAALLELSSAAKLGQKFELAPGLLLEASDRPVHNEWLQSREGFRLVRSAIPAAA
jgi:hypothetical protein